MRLHITLLRSFEYTLKAHFTVTSMNTILPHLVTSCVVYWWSCKMTTILKHDCGSRYSTSSLRLCWIVTDRYIFSCGHRLQQIITFSWPEGLAQYSLLAHGASKKIEDFCFKFTAKEISYYINVAFTCKMTTILNTIVGDVIAQVHLDIVGSWLTL